MEWFPPSCGISRLVVAILEHSTSIRIPWRQDSRPRRKPSRLGAKASGYLWNAQVDSREVGWSRRLAREETDEFTDNLV